MKWNGTRRAIALAGVACAVVLLTAPDAKAITLTVNSVVKTASDTANYINNNSNSAGEWQSAVSTLNAGSSKVDFLGQTVTGATRYASVLGSDTDPLQFATRTDNATSNYSVQFTVSAVTGYTYSLAIDTKFLGYLVNRNEGSGNGTEAILTNVTGTINAVSNANLGLATSATQTLGGNTATAVSKNATLNLTGLTGTNVYTLNFTWTERTSSNNNISNSDEAVVLLGLGSGVSSSAGNIGAADDYPGTSGVTNPATLGHFATFTATITAVPEPSTFALAGIGLVVGGLAAWRRRRLRYSS